MALRLIFMGTPDFAVPALTALANNGHEIAAVYTRAPKPAGRRGLELTASPVEREARRLGLSVHTPGSFKGPDTQSAFAAHRADVAVVVAYGLLLPREALDTPRLGCFNVHASLLPRWRGAAPINRAIMAGDAETGVTIMKMDQGLDTGAMALTGRLPIAPDMTAGELHDALAPLGAGLMVRALDDLEKGALQLAPQPRDGVTYAQKIDKAETRIDWVKPWKTVHDHVRGLSPFPGAWCEMPDAGRVKVLRTTKGDGDGPPGAVLDGRLTIACGEGAVRILELQKAGGKPMRAEDFLRGSAIKTGLKLA